MDTSVNDGISLPAALYLDLLKKSLTRYLFGETYYPLKPCKGSLRRALYVPIKRLLASYQLELVRCLPYDPALRAGGYGHWPAEAETMIGLQRLDNLQDCIVDVLRRKVPGDLIETGVWRGGATIFMRAVLKALGDSERVVWVADSFCGLPKPNAGQYPADEGDTLWTQEALAVSLDEVKRNFQKYGLLDEQVRFLVGWFRDTLPKAPIAKLSILRIDGDMYESTMDSLRYLYPKLSVGGYVIVDDYGVAASCKAAVEDYRTTCTLTEEVHTIDATGVFWQRLR